MEYRLGNVVRHEARKAGFYKVVGFEGNSVLIKRCKKVRGWPLSDARACYKVPVTDKRLSVYDAGEYTQDVNVHGTAAPAVHAQTAMTIAQLKENPWRYSENIIKEFETLLCDLSPENLWCDGEATAAQARAAEREINRKWALLEQYVGVTVVKEY